MNLFRKSREERAAEQRWAAINAQAWDEQEGRCRCGAPVTHVRKVPVVGRVPFKIFTCSEHVNVNAWAGRADGTFAPSNPHLNFDVMESRWSGTVEPLREKGE